MRIVGYVVEYVENEVCNEGCLEKGMKRNRKLFNKAEKIVISVSVVAIVLFVQVVSLYSDKRAEVRATTGEQVKHEQVLDGIQQDESGKKEDPLSIEKEKQHKTEPKQEQSTVTKKEKANEDKVDKHGEVNKEEPIKAKTDKKQSSKRKVAYLTIDDGPSEVEHGILDLLAEYDATATFFMLEPSMRKYPDAVKRIVDEGHVPALHGVTHDAKKFYRSKDSVLQEMNKAQKTLEEITGVQSTLIRTPYGSSPNMTPAYRQAVKENGYQLWDWNVDSRDWKYMNGAFVQHSIEQIEYVTSKGEDPIILIHSRGTTLKHLPKLLDYLVEQGYSLEGLDDSMETYVLP